MPLPKVVQGADNRAKSPDPCSSTFPDTLLISNGDNAWMALNNWENRS